MSIVLEKIVQETLNLSRVEQAELAYRLLENLDSESGGDSNFESEWKSEIERREEDLKTGKARKVPAAEAEKHFYL